LVNVPFRRKDTTKPEKGKRKDRGKKKYVHWKKPPEDGKKDPYKKAQKKKEWGQLAALERGKECISKNQGKTKNLQSYERGSWFHKTYRKPQRKALQLKGTRLLTA